MSEESLEWEHENGRNQFSQSTFVQTISSETEISLACTLQKLVCLPTLCRVQMTIQEPLSMADGSVD